MDIFSKTRHTLFSPFSLKTKMEGTRNNYINDVVLKSMYTQYMF